MPDELEVDTDKLREQIEEEIGKEGGNFIRMIALTTAITAGGNSPSTRQVAASRVRFNRDAGPPGLGRAAGAPWPQPRPP